jgi:hypothetical protein
MVVRSIKLKMILPRGEEGRRLRESLWLTHSAVNQAAARIEEVLLLCRGREYSTTEGTVFAGKVAEAAITLARKVQAANGRPGVATDEEILAALRQLYEAIVPSVVLDSEGKPLSATAQAAGAFVGPLMDPRSRGFLNVFEKVLDGSIPPL